MSEFNQYELSFTGSETFDELKATGEQIAMMNASSHWWVGDWLNEMLDRFPQRGQVIAANQKWVAYAEIAEAYKPDERKKGVSFEIHAYLKDHDDRHKQLILAHQEGHTLKDVRDRNSEQIEHDLGRGKRLSRKHLNMIEGIAEIHGKTVDIGEEGFKFATLKDAQTAQDAVKLAVETALKGR